MSSGASTSSLRLDDISEETEGGPVALWIRRVGQTGDATALGELSKGLRES